MAASQPEIYTIFCLVLGEDIPFSIEIANNETVDYLKKMIKEKRPGLFASIDDAKLTLYSVEILSDELAKKLEEKCWKGQTPLSPMKKLAGLFGDGPKEDTLHIIVEPPKSTPTNTPGQLSSAPMIKEITPLASHEEIKHKITSFEPGLRRDILNYLEKDVQLPCWQPQHGSEATRKHIENLRIPMISHTSNSPSLLLHNLGQPSHDLLLARRVKALFGEGLHQRFLCNTSGTGKSRLLFEGLWRDVWGLYYTARTLPDGIGSSDLREVLDTLRDIPRLTKLNEENRETALAANREVAARRFQRILYVRLWIFRVFLECASKMLGGITDKHKSRWLLIQLAPKALLGRSDVFTALNRLIDQAPLSYFVTASQVELVAIHEFLAPHTPRIFCVLDEAQVPAAMFSDFFLSATHPPAPRPILRQIIYEWEKVLPNLIISGTGLSMRELETVIASAIAKDTVPEPQTITDLGAFDNEKEQRGYLEKYFPPGFLMTESGTALAARIGYWLHGRHRFTAAYLSRLIQTGFQSPNRVLNEFVYQMTNVWPSDVEINEPPLPLELVDPFRIDFSKLQEEPDLIRQVAGFIFDYIFNSKPRDMGGATYEKLVEYGVARFGNLKNITADEPLALLAALDYFSKNTTWTPAYFLRNALTIPNPSARGIAFEQFCAYALGRAFSKPATLSTVFKFIGDNNLKDKKAQLVAMHKEREVFVWNPVDLTTNMQPTYILGRSPQTEEETLSWLKDPARTVFCFPANTVGPDLILVLRLSDNRLIPVIVQFKNEILPSMSPKDTTDAFRTTDPNSFISRSATPSSGDVRGGRSTNSREHSLRDPKLTASFVAALEKLVGGPTTAGGSKILRVLATHPIRPNLNALTSLVEADEGKYLAATLDMNILAEHLSGKELFKSLEERVVISAMQKSKKRTRDDDTEVRGGIKRR